ncbi:MAG: hypothetical protein COZ85_01225 [Candidatus Moranbacteria bacterium CG_4_8_14_3_um_filter_34_16]|nr:MAG: hypothetical protein COZ85_01225 [Candidatus Moranbacteria bacterium CG_4_8_14_3_um_filter_34_16]
MQTIPDELTNIIASKSQKLAYQLRVAWDLNDFLATITFAVVGTSVVSGQDIVKGNAAAVTEWDKYTYENETQYVKKYEFIRETGFPLNSVIKSRASIVLDNTSKRFLPHALPFGTAVEIDDCDVATGWTQSQDGIAPTISTSRKEGTNSLNCGINTAASENTYAQYDKAPSVIDISSIADADKKIALFLYVKDKTKLATANAVEIRIGSDATTNYYRIQIVNSEILQNGWNEIKKAATKVGTPVQTAIDTIRVIFNEATVPASVTLGDLKIDYIRICDSTEEDNYIGPFIRGGRFIKLFSGYNAYSIPQFVGMTDRPKNNIKLAETIINAYDVLHYLETWQMSTGYLLEDHRGDEVIAQVLADAGFTAGQSSLETSMMTIPFTWIKKGQKALDIIRKVCEAENATFYVDEEGIMCFENRYHLSQSPHTSSQYTLDYDEEIIDVGLEPTEVINKAKITAMPREVQASQKIFEKEGASVINAGETLELWAEFQDDYGELPCTAITEPTAGGATSYFKGNTSENGTETDKTNDLSIITWETLGGTIAKMIFTNSGASKVYLTELVIFGTPAKVVKEISYETPDTDAQESIDEFGLKFYELKNDLIQSADYARTLGDTIVYSFKEPKKSLETTIKGLPHLQLEDMVTVNEGSTGETYYMYVAKIEKLAEGYFYKVLLREKVIQSYAIVGTSLVDDGTKEISSDVVGP